MEFYELAIGARFVFRGRRFEKIWMIMANDEHGRGSILLGETEVVPDGVPLLLPPAEAAWWKPSDRHLDRVLESRAPAKGAGAEGTRKRQAVRLACFAILWLPAQSRALASKRLGSLLTQAVLPV
jgi:hypothetical protein